MSRAQAISSAISFVLVVWSAIVLAAATASAAESSWIEVHSSHYTVVTDAGEKKGREIALRFEQMRAVFATLLMKGRLNDPVPLTILAFRNDKTYYQTAPLRQSRPIDVPGFFVPGEDQNFIVLNLFEEEPWRAVAHDLGHLLLNYNYPPAQGWFDEGLAEYFSSIRVDDKKYEIGGDPELQSRMREDLLQNQSEARNSPKSLTELLSGQVWLALPDLLTMKHDTSGYAEGTHHTLFYAQSWMVMHYLLQEKKLPETGAYFDLVQNQHVPAEEAFQKAFGVTPAQFDDAVKKYFHSLATLFTAMDDSKQQESKRAGQHTNAAQPYQFPEIVAPNDSAITIKALPEADARALAAQVKTRIPERREAGLKELQLLAITPDPKSAKLSAEKSGAGKTDDEEKSASLATATGNEIAHRALAWDHLQHSEFDAAAEELSDAALLNQRDLWIRYYLCLLKYAIGQSKHTEITGLPNILQDLRAVLEWYPEMASAYDLMAIARMQGGGPAAAMQAERAAIQLSPRNQEYVFHLAEIYISDKKFDAARALLGRLKSGSDQKIAAAAAERLEQIGNVQKYGIAATAAKPLATQSSPFDVLEQDAAKRAAAAKSAQSSGSTADTRSAKFVQGRLVAVDCSQAPAAMLTVSSSGGILKLRTADYKSLLIIGPQTFSCAWSDRSVSVNYKPGGMADGDVVSLEVR